jgi:hypothetical protein
MSMLSWIVESLKKPNRANPMLENECPNQKCCKNPSCKMNKTRESFVDLHKEDQ